MTRNLIGRRAAVAGTLGGIVAAHSRIAWAADPIKIGFSIPQSGGLAAIGKQALLTMQIWADDVNAKGGIIGRPVQLVTYDDQSSPANVPPHLHQAARRRQSRSHRHQRHQPHGAGDADRHAARQGGVLHAGAGHQRQVQVPALLPDHAVRPARQGLDQRGLLRRGDGHEARKPTTVALVGADAEFSKSAVEGARDEAKKRGLKVVYDRTYPPSTVDFGPVIRGIATANPDLVYVGSYPVDTSGPDPRGARTELQPQAVRRRHGRHPGGLAAGRSRRHAERRRELRALLPGGGRQVPRSRRRC